MDDLFTSQLGNFAPLAVRMRPRTLSEVAGQKHLTNPGMPLSRLLDGSEASSAHTSIILWGAPGTGKTTLAMLAATVNGRRFVQLSAVTAGVKEVRDVIESSRELLSLYQKQTVLFIDEVHRFSKSQQDALLPGVENGWVTLIAATTENPSFSVISPLLSRSIVLTLQSLNEVEIGDLLERALNSTVGLNGEFEIAEDAINAIVSYAGGDARRALTALDAGAAMAAVEKRITITAIDVQTGAHHIAPSYDKDGDMHYDVVSAFIKSLRGSDVDASLHYLARMIVAGEDPRFIARRLIVHASEDVGLADPTALLAAVAAANTVALIGLPEARIALAQATIQIALAPKSNSVISAIDSAIVDVKEGNSGQIPIHLRDSHYPGALQYGYGSGYLYPHDYPGSIVVQQYLPNELSNRSYYKPGPNGDEVKYSEILQRIFTYLKG
jgi:putative ATPase